MNNIFKSFLLGIITWYILKKLIPLLSKNFLDKPNERSSHTKPIPSGGGISFVLVSCASCSILGYWTPTICLPLAFIGFLDDYYGISALIRYFFQVLTIGVLLLNSSLLNNYSYSLDGLEYILTFLFMLITGTAIINFINFMDGLDGFLISNIVIIFTSSAILFNNNIMLLIGPLLAFAIFNWQPAKVFMGDVGSTYLGAIFFGILINTNSINDAFLTFLMGFPLLSDAFICLFRRYFAGQNIFKPHKLHLYQRLNQSGLSHQKVTFLYGTATLLISLISIFKFEYIFLLIVSFLFFGIYLDKNIAVSFKSQI